MGDGPSGALSRTLKRTVARVPVPEVVSNEAANVKLSLKGLLSGGGSWGSNIKFAGVMSTRSSTVLS